MIEVPNMTMSTVENLNLKGELVFHSTYIEMNFPQVRSEANEPLKIKLPYNMEMLAAMADEYLERMETIRLAIGGGGRGVNY